MRQFILLLTMGTLALTTACTTAQTSGQSSRNPLLVENFVAVASDAQLMRHIEYPANLGGHHPSQGHTPLTMMITHRYGSAGLDESTQRLVKAMLERGADVHGRVAPNNDPFNDNAAGWVPLHYAVHYNHAPLVQMLIEAGADPNYGHAPNTYTPLELAVIENNVTIVRLLLAAGADPNRTDNGHQTILTGIARMKASGGPTPNPQIIALVRQYGGHE